MSSRPFLPVGLVLACDVQWKVSGDSKRSTWSSPARPASLVMVANSTVSSGRVTWPTWQFVEDWSRPSSPGTASRRKAWPTQRASGFLLLGSRLATSSATTVIAAEPGMSVVPLGRRAEHQPTSGVPRQQLEGGGLAPFVAELDEDPAADERVDAASLGPAHPDEVAVVDGVRVARHRVTSHGDDELVGVDVLQPGHGQPVGRQVPGHGLGEGVGRAAVAV